MKVQQITNTVRASAELFRTACAWTSLTGERVVKSPLFGLTVGAILLTHSLEAIALAQPVGNPTTPPSSGGSGVNGLPFYSKQMAGQMCNVIVLAQGPFGALIMAMAGIVAIVSAAVGSFRTALNAFCVGAGAWLIQPLIMLFFGPNADCGFTNGLTIGGGGGIHIPFPG